MPIYEYACAKCGNVDEHLMRFSDPDPDGCTKCGGPVARKISQTSFQLKGSGWYVTDYKKDAIRTAEAAEGGGVGATSTADGKPAEPGDGAAGTGAAVSSAAGSGGETKTADAKPSGSTAQGERSATAAGTGGASASSPAKSSGEKAAGGGTGGASSPGPTKSAANA